MRRPLLVLALVLALAAPAVALEWGGVEPGVTTVEQVRERYGQPSKDTRPKVEGYDTQHWVYEDARAPAGLYRMTVDFGILTPAGYKPGVVRLLTLEPKPNIFGRYTVIQGWGLPDVVNDDKSSGATLLLWKDGLLVTFDKDNENAVSMVFSVPQPLPQSPPSVAPPPPGAAPKR